MERSTATHSQVQETIAENVTRDTLEKKHMVYLFHKVASEKGAPPFDMEWLARVFELSVEHRKLMDSKISGWIERQQGDKFHIVINKEHPGTRQRFTLAHEIAHFILHEDHIKDKISDDKLYRSALSNDLEREANAYAAHILMPYSFLRHDVEKQLKEQHIYEANNYTEILAKKYLVSEQAMAIRLGTEFGMWV